MSDEDLIECRLCGRRWRSLGHHLRWGHGISADDYRDQFGMRRSQPLTSSGTRTRMGNALKQTIATGKLDHHFAGNGERAHIGARAARAALLDLRARGMAMPFGRTPRLTHENIAAVVVAIEAGAKVATAVKRSGISYSAYHAGLARYPDLKARHDQGRMPSLDR